MPDCEDAKRAGGRALRWGQAVDCVCDCGILNAGDGGSSRSMSDGACGVEGGSGWKSGIHSGSGVGRVSGWGDLADGNRRFVEDIGSVVGANGERGLGPAGGSNVGANNGTSGGGSGGRGSANGNQICGANNSIGITAGFNAGSGREGGAYDGTKDGVDGAGASEQAAETSAFDSRRQHATAGAFRNSRFVKTRSAKQTTHTRLRNCRERASHTEKLAACGRNTSMPINIANNSSVTTRSGFATSNLAISRGTSTYVTTSALAPHTPTILEAEFLSELIAGRDGSRSWSAKLTFENAEPVSTSPSRTSTPYITASENNSETRGPADNTAPVDSGFD